MKNSALASLKGYFRNANRWWLKTPERALNEAYEAALAIKSLEDAHFDGNRIAANTGNYSRSAETYFQSELKKYLDIIKIRLAEFKTSSSIIRLSNQSITEVQLEDNNNDLRSISVIDRPGLILKKLRFIDDVLARYETRETNPGSVLVVSEPKQISPTNPQAVVVEPSDNSRRKNKTQGRADMKSLTDKTGVLPRSILETVDRIKRDLDPEAEQEIVQEFRSSRSRTNVALRFVLLLVIIPLLTQQVTKNFVVGPIVDHYRINKEQVAIFLNTEMEEEALTELQRYQERLRFETLIGQAEPRSEEEILDLVREKADEIKQEYINEGSDAIKNIFADLAGFAAFAIVLFTSRREVQVLKTFMDQLVYGLSDSAKAFIIILFTDIFVGFHSPHGWEVILEGVSKHFGLPANRDFIFLFIATFPVILDTIFKYWIFRYLNRVSPSAVATYRNMNE
ncbi:MAG TPA: proton extrusion protein PcxA [Trichocoleus sp.]